jgi:hypothetical protein
MPLKKPLRNTPMFSEVSRGPGSGPENGPEKGVFGRLARPAKRHYTFARRRLDGIRQPATNAAHQASKALISRCFAPFVYRLGRHPFTVERAVRFR